MTARKTPVRTGEFASIGFKGLNANVSFLLLDLDAISLPQVGLLRKGMFAFQKGLITAMLAPIHAILILIGRNADAWEIATASGVIIILFKAGLDLAYGCNKRSAYVLCVLIN